MTIIPGVLRISEDLSKFSEAFQHLERCYASNSDSVNVALTKFLAELSQLEQGETLVSIRAKVRSSVQALAVPIDLLLKTQKQARIVIDKVKKIKDIVLASELKSDCVELEEFELEKAVTLIYKTSISVYTLLSKSVNESWNYFPVEIHQVFEKWANILCGKQELDSDIATSVLVKLERLDKESEAAVGEFIYSVRKAVEKNKFKPKLQLLKLVDYPLHSFLNNINSPEIWRAVEENDSFQRDKTDNLTLEEFWALPESETAYELVDGKAIPKVSPKEFHSTLTFALTTLLTRWAKGRGRVRLEWALTLERNGIDWSPVPEVTYVSYERLPKSIFRNQACPVPPEFVIEVISPGQTMRDFENKATDYFNAGVLRVWVVDSEAISITVFSSDSTPQLYTSNTKILDTLLPGLELSTQLIFEEAELL